MSDEPNSSGGVEEFLAPFFSDSTLWPLVLVLAACLSTLGAAILVAAVYHQNPLVGAALLALAWLSFDLSKRHRREIGRLGRLGWSIISLWLLSAVIGGVAISLGFA